MFQKIQQPRKPFKAARKKYKCLLCSWIIANRGQHLENQHDFDRFLLRSFEGEEKAEEYFKQYFEETENSLTCLKHNYNKSLTNKELQL